MRASTWSGRFAAISASVSWPWRRCGGPVPYATQRLVLVAVMGAIVYAAFFIAVFAMPIYGRGAYDDNGYRPFAAPIPIIAKRWDLNITVFSIRLVLLAAGKLAIVGTASS
jgi:hypothetical protein